MASTFNFAFSFLASFDLPRFITTTACSWDGLAYFALGCSLLGNLNSCYQVDLLIHPSQSFLLQQLGLTYHQPWDCFLQTLMGCSSAIKDSFNCQAFHLIPQGYFLAFLLLLLAFLCSQDYSFNYFPFSPCDFDQVLRDFLLPQASSSFEVHSQDYQPLSSHFLHLHCYPFLVVSSSDCSSNSNFSLAHSSLQALQSFAFLQVILNLDCSMLLTSSSFGCLLLPFDQAFLENLVLIYTHLIYPHRSSSTHRLIDSLVGLPSRHISILIHCHSVSCTWKALHRWSSHIHWLILKISSTHHWTIHLTTTTSHRLVNHARSPIK